MIVAGKSQSQKPKISPIGTRPSRAGYFPAIYEVGKIGLRSYGLYKDFERYLPDKYVDKYTYKPHKRVTGYAWQISKKFQKNDAGNKFYKECSRYDSKHWHNDTASTCR